MADGQEKSDILSECTDSGHVSIPGKMTDGKGEYPDMCVSLSEANWLVHPHADECTTGRAGEEQEKKNRTTDKIGETKIGKEQPACNICMYSLGLWVYI